VSSTLKNTLVRTKLSEQIADQLRDEIIHQLLPPGSHLVQSALCERFGTSRMPVRDALQRLTHEGLLVERGDYREVAELGSTEIGDVNSLIAVLHGWAAHLTTERASQEELDDLAALCDETNRATEPLIFSQLSDTFHRRINLLSCSQSLIRTISSLQGSVPRVFPLSLPWTVEVEAREQYRLIVAAMNARDADRAEALTRDSVLTFTRLVVSYLGGSDGKGSERGAAGHSPVLHPEAEEATSYSIDGDTSL
jgi:DNA-binding GntR family transcriptional regulator